MAQFELNIYGDDNEILKTHTTDFVRWGVYLQALELSDNLKDKSAAEQFKAINTFVKKIFPALTDAELENADADDVLNTFRQLIAKSSKLTGRTPKNAAGENSKNVAGAE